MFLTDTTISKVVHFFVHIKCEVDLRTQKETRGGQSAMQLVLLPADKHTQTQREINIPPTSSVISLCHEYTHTSYEHSCILTMFVLCVCIKCVLKHTPKHKKHTLTCWSNEMWCFGSPYRHFVSAFIVEHHCCVYVYALSCGYAVVPGTAMERKCME